MGDGQSESRVVLYPNNIHSEKISDLYVLLIPLPGDGAFLV